MEPKEMVGVDDNTGRPIVDPPPEKSDVDPEFVAASQTDATE